MAVVIEIMGGLGCSTKDVGKRKTPKKDRALFSLNKSTLLGQNENVAMQLLDTPRRRDHGGGGGGRRGDDRRHGKRSYFVFMKCPWISSCRKKQATIHGVQSANTVESFLKERNDNRSLSKIK